MCFQWSQGAKETLPLISIVFAKGLNWLNCWLGLFLSYSSHYYEWCLHLWPDYWIKSQGGPVSKISSLGHHSRLFTSVASVLLFTSQLPSFTLQPPLIPQYPLLHHSHPPPFTLQSPSLHQSAPFTLQFPLYITIPPFISQPPIFTQHPPFMQQCSLLPRSPPFTPKHPVLHHRIPFCVFSPPIHITVSPSHITAALLCLHPPFTTQSPLLHVRHPPLYSSVFWSLLHITVPVRDMLAIARLKLQGKGQCANIYTQMWTPMHMRARVSH